MAERIKLFFLESRQELRRVNWPTREETIRLTLIVIGISLFVSLFLGVFDYLFLTGLKWFLEFRQG